MPPGSCPLTCCTVHPPCLTDVAKMKDPAHLQRPLHNKWAVMLLPSEQASPPTKKQEQEGERAAEAAPPAAAALAAQAADGGGRAAGVA